MAHASPLSPDLPRGVLPLAGTLAAAGPNRARRPRAAVEALSPELEIDPLASLQ